MLYALVKFIKPGRVLEVGAGYTSLWLLQALRDNPDPDPDPDPDPNPNPNPDPSARQGTVARCWRSRTLRWLDIPPTAVAPWRRVRRRTTG